MSSNARKTPPRRMPRRIRAWVANQGFERVGLLGFWWRHGRLPDVDWSLLAAFAAIAGAGGLSNALFSNYARDKGWGMGAKVGAIPSAIGGRSIALSHVGMVFPITPTTLKHWKGWFRHIVRDQVAVWMLCSVVGLALPCMLSLEFLRNTPVSDHRVAAMTAQGMAARFPDYAAPYLVVRALRRLPHAGPLCRVLGRPLGPALDRHPLGNEPSGQEARGQPGPADLLLASRRSTRSGARSRSHVLSPLQIAIVGAVLGNVALGFSAFHTLYVNRTLLPRELRPNLVMQLGLIGCGVFFFAITAMALSGSLIQVSRHGRIRMATIMITSEPLHQKPGKHVDLLRDEGFDVGFPELPVLISENETVEVLQGASAVIAGSGPVHGIGLEPIARAAGDLAVRRGLRHGRRRRGHEARRGPGDCAGGVTMGSGRRAHLRPAAGDYAAGRSGSTATSTEDSGQNPC